MTTKDIYFSIFLLFLVGGGVWYNHFLNQQMLELNKPTLQSYEPMPCHEARNTPVVWIDTKSCIGYEEHENNTVRCATQYANYTCLNRN